MTEGNGMSLREALLKESPKGKPGPICGFTKVRKTLTDDDRLALDEAVELVRGERASAVAGQRTEHTATWIHASLIANGHKVSLLTTQKHIAKSCGCGY